MIAKYKKSILVKRPITVLTVMTFALLQTYVIQAFMRPANLLSSGLTGVAILINRIASLYGHSIPTSLEMLALNIPVAILRSRSISMRFTSYSILQVFLASFSLRIRGFQPLFNDMLLDVVFGGFLYGLSIVIALEGNVSTGGMDLIALYISNKTGRSIWECVLAGDCVILYIFGYMFGWLYAGYSILFQLISTKAISAFHHRCERATLQVITTKAPGIINQHVKQYKHGISCMDAVGGYNCKKIYLLRTMVPSYEVNDIVHLIREQDSHVIVNVIKTENFYNGFYQAPIE